MRFADAGWDIALHRILLTLEKSLNYTDRVRYIESNTNPAFMKINSADLYNYYKFRF
jgi:hypothetical protein